MNPPPLSAVMFYSFAALWPCSGKHCMPEQSDIVNARATHSSMFPMKVQEKQHLFRFIHALAYLFKDVLKEQEILSCPLRHKDTLILQLPLRRNAFCFRELLWFKVGGIRGLTGLSGATAILSPNHPAYALSTLISSANLHEWRRKGESLQYYEGRMNRTRSKRHLCFTVRSEKFGHI